jgi:hypothetical protein
LRFVASWRCPEMSNRKRSPEPVARLRRTALTGAQRAPVSLGRSTRVRWAKAKYLDQVEKHVVEGELRVRQQRELVAMQAARGDDTSLSERLLARFEEVLVLHVADRRRLIKELPPDPKVALSTANARTGPTRAATADVDLRSSATREPSADAGLNHLREPAEETRALQQSSPPLAIPALQPIASAAACEKRTTTVRRSRGVKPTGFGEAEDAAIPGC